MFGCVGAENENLARLPWLSFVVDRFADPMQLTAFRRWAVNDVGF